MLNDRRRIVLSALVEEYVHSAQPVASRSIVDRSRLRCSPATVRNDLAALEETGLVFQPHVSSGRVPTDSGYRVFVDDLAPSECLTPEEAAGVRRTLGELEVEFHDLMRETAQVLARLSGYAAVAVAPMPRRARIRRVSLVPMGPRRVLVVVVTDGGQVVNRPVEFADPIGEEALAASERTLNAHLDGRVAAEVGALREPLAGTDGDAVAAGLLTDVAECLVEADRDRLHHAGVSALLAQPEFADPEVIRPLVAVLENGVAFLRALGESASAEDVTVRIGHENDIAELGRLSFVAAAYGGSDGGVVGLIGPTRMEYARAMSAVRCVADGLSSAMYGA
ncbi:MAG: heat-inducible transcriptional repressor HrcA [Coriobacteriia bacterium]